MQGCAVFEKGAWDPIPPKNSENEEQKDGDPEGK